MSAPNIRIENAIYDFLDAGNTRDQLLVFTDDTGQHAEVAEMAQDLKILCSLIFRATNYREVVSRYQRWILELSTELGFPVAELHFCELTNPKTPEWRNVAWERRLRILHDASSMFVELYEHPCLVTYCCGGDWEAVSRALPSDFWIGMQLGSHRRRTRTLQVVHSRLVQRFLEGNFSNMQSMLIQDAGDERTHTKLVFPNWSTVNIHDNATYFYDSRDECGIQFADIAAGFCFRAWTAREKGNAGAGLTGTDRAIIEAIPERLQFKSLI